MRSDIPAESRLVLIPYRRVFGERSGLEAYAERLAGELPRGPTIECLASLCALHYDDVANRSSVEQRCRLAMLGPRSTTDWVHAVEEFIDHGGILIHPLGLAMLMRLALLHAVEDRPPGNDFVDRLVKLMLVVNDLFADQQGIVGPETSDEDLIDIELLGAILPESDTTSVLARASAFLRWADEQTQSSDNWIDVRADFARFFGITADEYLVGAAFVVLHFVFASGRLSKLASSTILLSSLERTFSNPQILQRWVALFVAPLDTIRDELVASKHDYSSASLVTFLRHPLICVDGERIICPLPSTLDNLLGVGFYFTLFDAYKRNDEEQNALRFASMYGHFFEYYVGTLLDRIASTTVLRERTYTTQRGHVQTSDYFILDDAARLVVIEVVKTRLNLQTTLMQRNRKSLVEDIRRIILTNLRQAARTLRDLRAGLFQLPLQHADLTGVYLLIVAGQRLPGLYGVNSVISHVLDKEKALTEMQAVHVMDVDELEILAAEHNRTLPLGALLETKGRHAERYARTCRLQSFIDRYSHVIPAGRRIVSADYDIFFDHLVMPTLSTWGLSP